MYISPIRESRECVRGDPPVISVNSRNSFLMYKSLLKHIQLLLLILLFITMCVIMLSLKNAIVIFLCWRLIIGLFINSIAKFKKARQFFCN